MKNYSDHFIMLTSENKNYSYSIRNGIRILLVTCTIALAMNFACAQGSGVVVLSWLGFVSFDAIDMRENILAGVDFMQLSIKVVIGIGLTLFCFCVYRAVHQYKRGVDY